MERLNYVKSIIDRTKEFVEQVRATLAHMGAPDTSVRLQAEGHLLSDFLPPKPVIAAKPKAAEPTPKAAGSALAGKKIAARK